MKAETKDLIFVTALLVFMIVYLLVLLGA